MTKKSPVISENRSLKTIVAEYDGKPIQITGNYKIFGKFLYIEEKNGVFVSVDKPTTKLTKRVIQDQAGKPDHE